MMETKGPSRGQVWDIRFDPSVGAEMRKVRPAVVISEDSIGRLPLRIVVPITEWKAAYAGYPWFVHLPAGSARGLSKDSGADAFQIKSVSINRFETLRGTLTDSELDDIASAVALCVGAP